MAVRGENVGTAYVRILADGTGLDKSIKDQFEDVDFGQFGRKASKEWTEGFEEEQESKPNQRRLRDALAGPLVRGRWLRQEFFTSKNWTDFRSGLRKEYGDAGYVAGENFEKRLMEGMRFESFDRLLDNIIPELLAAEQQIRRAQKSGVDLAKQMEETGKTAQEVTEAATVAAEKDRKVQAERRQEIARLRTEFALLNRESAQLFAGSREAMGKDVLLRKVEEIRTSMARLQVENSLWKESLHDTERQLIRHNPRLARYNHSLGVLADRMGRLTGRGARNDFINLMGATTRGMVLLAGSIVKLPLAIGKVAKGIFDLGRGFASILPNMRDMIRGAKTIGEGFAGIAASFGSSIPGLLALAGAAAAALLVIGPLIASLSMLTGAVTALASSLAYAAVGVIGSLAAVALPAAGAIAGLALAFTGLSDAQKKALKVDFKPVANSFERLQEAVRRPLLGNLRDDFLRLGKVLDGFVPTMRGIGRALEDMGDDWTRSMQSRGFRQFRDSFERFLPGAIRDLGSILKQTTGGLGGLFRGMIPFMRDTLDWLDRITLRFSDWANSAKGQNSIKNFFEDAKQSAKDVGEFLGSVRDLLGEVMSAGRGPGGGIFRDMAGGIDKWTAALRKDPDILKRWFADAREFANSLAAAARGIARVVDALDNAATRDVAKAYFESLGLAFGAIGEGVKLITNPLGYLATKLLPNLAGSSKSAQGPIEALAASFDKVTGAATRATRAMIRDKLAKEDTIAQTRQYGIATEDLIGAVMGLPGPTKRVNDALSKNKDLLNGLNASDVRADLEKLGITFDKAAGKAKESADGLTTWRERMSWLADTVKKNKDLKARIRVIGMDGTMGELRSLQKQFKLTPKEIRTVAKAVGIDLTKKDVKGLIADWKKLDKEQASPKVGMDKKEADKKAKDLMKQMDVIDKIKSDPTIGIVDGLFQRGEKNARNALSILDRMRVNPTVGINDQASGRVQQIKSMISSITGKTVTITTHYAATGSGKIPRTATGGLFNGAQIRMIGEAGPEAVVPLNRPLSQVDPAVRELSAIAQGLQVPRMARGGVVGKTIDASGWQIITPTEDPRAVAVEVLNRMTAAMV